MKLWIVKGQCVNDMSIGLKTSCLHGDLPTPNSLMWRYAYTQLIHVAICLHPTRLHGDSPTANLPTQPLTKIPHLFLIAVFFCKLSYSRNYLKISYAPWNSQNKLWVDNWFWSEYKVLSLIVPMSLALN